MRICFNDKDGQGGETPDLAEVVKALTAERDKYRKDFEAHQAEVATWKSKVEAARKTVSSIYHEREVSKARHPNALASMPALELDDDFRPTKASMEARAKWWKENEWAKLEAVKPEVKPEAAPEKPTDTPASKPDASGQDATYWKKLRREDPVEFKRRSKEYDAWCENEDRRKGLVP